MPKIIIHAPQDTLSLADRAEIDSALTDLALDCEGLPPSPFLKRGLDVFQ